MDRRQQVFNAATLYAVILLAGFTLGACDSAETSNVLFEDNFEQADCLGKWIVGGRQLEGTNVANCMERNGSVVGHLFKFSFTEITLAPDQEPFPFDGSLTFNFEMEVRVSSTGGAPSNYYGSAGVSFDFSDTEDSVLGSVSYLAATTPFPFQNVVGDSTRNAVQISDRSLKSYTLRASDILSHINIDESQIASVTMRFRTYSSTRPIPHVEAELWVDNVSVGRS